MAEHIEVAKAFITIVPSLEGSQAEISKQLNAETEPASKEAGEKSGKSFGEGLGKGIKAAAGVITGAITAATGSAIALGKSFVEAAKGTAEMGDQISKSSQKLGISKKYYQELSYVLKLCGSDISNMTAGFKTMTNQVDKAKSGNKDAIANFKSLGISLKELKTLSREEIFDKVIEGLQKMPESTKRAALANKVLGKSGQDLQPLFNMTNSQMRAAIKTANDYGMIMDDKAIKSSENFQDSLTTLKGTITGLKNSLMSQFLPSLTSITDGLAMVFGSKSQADREAGIKTIEYGISNLAQKLTEVAPTFFEAAGKILSALIQGIAPMLPELIKALFSVLSQGIQTALTLLPELMPSIITAVTSFVGMLVQILPILIDGLMKILTALAQWLGQPENARTIANGIVTMITEISKTISTTLPILLPAIVQLIGEVAKCLTEEENLRLILDAIGKILFAIGEAILKSIPILLESIGKVIGNIFVAATDLVADSIEIFVNNFKTGWKMFTDWIANVGTGIVNFFTGIKNKIVEFFTNIKNKVGEFFTNVKNTFTNGLNAIKDGFSNVVNNIKGFFGGLLDHIKDIPKKAVELGKNIVSGIIDGVKNMAKKAIDSVKNLGKNMLDGIKGFFKIKSPSRLMRDQVGKNLALGIGVGFEQAWDGVNADINDTMRGFTADMSTEVVAGGTVTGSELGGTINNNSGNIVFNIYGAEGQNVNDLAEIIAVKLQDMTARKGAVFA